MPLPRYLSGRQRRIRLSGSYSYLVVFKYLANSAAMNTYNGGYAPIALAGFTSSGQARASLNRGAVQNLPGYSGMGHNLIMIPDARWENIVEPDLGTNTDGSADIAVYDSSGGERGRISVVLPHNSVGDYGTSDSFDSFTDDGTATTVASFADSGTYEIYVDAEEVWQVDYDFTKIYEATRPGGQTVRRITGSQVSETVITHTVRTELDHEYWPQTGVSGYSGGFNAPTQTVLITGSLDMAGFTVVPRPHSYGGVSETGGSITNGNIATSASYPVPLSRRHKVRRYTIGGTLSPETFTVWATNLFNSPAFASANGAGEALFDLLWEYYITTCGVGNVSTSNASTDGFSTLYDRQIAFRDNEAYVFEDPTYWRFQGLRFDAASVYREQDRWITRDPFQGNGTAPNPGGFNPDGTPGWHVVPLPVSGGTIVISRPAGPPPVLRIAQGARVVSSGFGTYQYAALNEHFTLEGRYIQIRFRSVGAANQPLRLTLIPHSSEPYPKTCLFDLTTGPDGEWVEREVDLLDARDYGNTGPPFYSPTYYPGENTRTTGEKIWGEFSATPPMQRVQEVRIDRLAYNTTYEVEWVRVRRKAQSVYTSLGLTGVTDGLPAPVALPDPDPDPLPSGVNPSAWVVTDLNPPTPGKPDLADDTPPLAYLPLDYLLESDYLGALAAPELGTQGRGGLVLDADASDPLGPATLSGCTYGQFLQIYAGAGAVFESAGVYALLTEVEWSRLVRGQAYGLVLGGTPEVVVVKTDGVAPPGPNGADVAEEGRGTPQALGSGAGNYFKTGSPYTSGGPHYRAWLDPKDLTGFDTLGMPEAARKWLLFRVLASGIWPSATLARSGRALRAYVKDGEIWVRAAGRVDLSDASEYATGIEGARPCLRAHWFGGGAVWLFYEADGGGLARRSTTDEGETWGMADTISADGAFPAFCVTPWGHVYVWRTDAGGIESKQMDPFGNLIFPATGAVEVVASGAAEDALTVWHNPEAGRLYVEYVDDSGAVVAVSSSDGGATWA